MSKVFIKDLLFLQDFQCCWKQSPKFSLANAPTPSLPEFINYDINCGLHGVAAGMVSGTWAGHSEGIGERMREKWRKHERKMEKGWRRDGERMEKDFLFSLGWCLNRHLIKGFEGPFGTQP